MWTNSTLRKHLGERGFFQEGPPIYVSATHQQTRWHRDGEEIIMFESLTGEFEPWIEFNHNRVDPNVIGWRNVNTQTGNTGPA